MRETFSEKQNFTYSRREALKRASVLTGLVVYSGLIAEAVLHNNSSRNLTETKNNASLVVEPVRASGPEVTNDIEVEVFAGTPTSEVIFSEE